jgi:hypothetical protein
MEHLNKWEMAHLELQNDNDYHDFLEDVEDDTHNSCPDTTSAHNLRKDVKSVVTEIKKPKHHTVATAPVNSSKFKFTPPVNVWKEFLPFFESLEKFTTEKKDSVGSDEKGHGGKRHKKNRGKDKGMEKTENFLSLVLESYQWVCTYFPLTKKTLGEFKSIKKVVARILSPNEILVDLVYANALCHHLHRSPIPTFMKVFEEGKSRKKDLNSKDFLTCDFFSGHGLQAWALAALHLCLSDRSPLSCTTAQYDDLGYVFRRREERTKK